MKKYGTIFLLIVSNILCMQPDKPNYPQFILKSVNNKSISYIRIKSPGHDVCIKNGQKYTIQKTLPIDTISVQNGVMTIKSAPEDWHQFGEPTRNPYIAHIMLRNTFFAIPFTYYSTMATDPKYESIKDMLPSKLEIYKTRQALGQIHRDTETQFYDNKICKFFFSITINDYRFGHDPKQAPEIEISTMATPPSLLTLCMAKALQFEQQEELTISGLPTDINLKIDLLKQFAAEKSKQTT